MSRSLAAYYMLECDSPVGKRRSLIDYTERTFGRDWISGARLDQPPTEPVRATVVSRADGVMLEMWEAPLPLMTRRMLAALQFAGVDNLEVFSAELTDPRTGEVFKDYVAFNVVGAVSAADLGKSRYQAPDGPLVSVDFDSVVLDPSRCTGALMFRLAEAVNAIVVHEAVRKGLLASGIDTLTFIEPENWAG